MAEAMTYSSLLTDMRNYLERGNSPVTDPEVYAQFPRIVMLTERQIARELKVLGFLNATVGTMTAGVAVYPKPDLWRETVSINFGAGTGLDRRTPLFARSYEYLRSYWPVATEESVPEFYADYNYDNWLFAPTPDEDYPFEIIYYQLLPLLDDSNQTNWLTQYAPDLLLMGCLLNATPFLKDDPRIATWQAMYDRDLASTNGEDIQKILDRAAERKGA